MSGETQSMPPQRPSRTWSERLVNPSVLFVLLLVNLVAWFCAHSGVADLDIWWHLRNAATLVHTGHFVRSDLWTFTAAGRPWINFEWLAELPFYGAWVWLGSQGLCLVMLILGSAIITGVYSLAWMRSRNYLASFAAATLAVFFATVSLAPRTLLFGWLFLVLELAILWSFQRGRDTTVWLPLLFFLWINTHGSWLIGFTLMLVFFACGCIAGEWGNLYATRWTRSQAQKLLIVLAASFAVLFVNPYGWRLVAYPLDVAFRQKQTIQNIAEWASLDFHTGRGKTVLATLLLFGVLQLIRRRRWNLQDLAFALIAVYAALTYVRFVFLAGILLAPLLAIDLAGGKQSPTPHAPPHQRWIVAGLMATLCAAIVAQFPSRRQLDAGIAAHFPQQSLPWVRSLAGRGHLFNDFAWGGYLAWQAPEVPDFIDSRVDIFVHEGILDDYNRAAQPRETLAVLDKYQIRWVLLAKDNPAVYLLQHNPEWKQVYADDLAVGLERIR